LAYILKTLVEQRFAARDTPLTIVRKNIGYELRSASPVAFDCEYVRTLGYGAVEFFLNQRTDIQRLHGALSCLVDGKLQFLDFADLLDPVTGKSRVRIVDTNKPSLQNCPPVHDPIGKRRPRGPRQVKNAGAGDIEPEQDLQA